MTFYITTAIPYVNAKPHIGFALEAVLTDAIARYHRHRGEDVWFLTGTDENSLKNVQAAEAIGVPTADLVAQNSERFRGLRDPLELSFDDFIRTSADSRHFAGVERLWRACAANGDIYTKAYAGKYCVGCEQFYGDSELIDGRCPVHRTVPDIVEEENYFFRLSAYQDQLIDLIQSDTLAIRPVSRKNEVLSFVRKGLEDFSISRSQARAHGWGVPVPDDPSQVIYVWYDALGNYITALGYATDGERYRRYWASKGRRVHVIGKDIIRFHAVYWPAMLLSAKVPLPTDILVHGFITVNGDKISKSLGNVIDPVELVDQVGADALRYYLLKEIRASDDGDFSTERFVRSYNADLADQLGNLLNRVANMTQRYQHGAVPEPGETDNRDRQLFAVAEALPERVDAAMGAFSTRDALTAIWELVGEANRYVEDTAPWKLAKQPETAARLDSVLYNLAESLRLIAVSLVPFLPRTAAAIADRLGVTIDGPYRDLAAWGQLRPGTTILGGAVLFPKIESITI